MGIRERVIELIDWSGMSTTDLEKSTGLDRYKWGNIRTKKQRVNEEHLEAIEKIWPQFSYWVVSGKTLPEAGQISPDIEKKRNSQAR